MNKNKIVSVVAISLATVVVAVVSVLFIKHYSSTGNENVKPSESVTAFSVLGDIDSETEKSSEKTEVVTDENGKDVTEVVTDKKGEKVTDKNGKIVTERVTGIVKPFVTKNDKKVKTTAKPKEKITAVGKDSPVTNENASKQAGAFGFIWDSNANVFYSTSDPWQRQFGYNQYYDKLAGYAVLWFDTVRIKFNYGGNDWLVQFWKGQYGFVLLGAEAGVYYKDENSTSSHYICTDNSKRLKIGYTCYNKGDVLFRRDYQDTWWLTGFVPGRLDKFADRSQLTMQMRITLKDEEMTNAFVEALGNAGFTRGNASTPDTYYTSGNNVYLMWKTDRSKTS